MNEKGDLGTAKCFFKKPGMNLLPCTCNPKLNKLSAPTSLSQEQAAKTSHMTDHMTDHAPMQLEKHYTCLIERRWHIPYKFPSTMLAIGLLVSNARIQLKIVKQ